MSHDVGDDVHYVRITFDLHEPRHVDCAWLGDATDVIAAQIDEHDVLGALLFIRQQPFGEGLVFLGRVAARHRASDGSRGDLAVLDEHQ